MTNLGLSHCSPIFLPALPQRCTPSCVCWFMFNWWTSWLNPAVITRWGPTVTSWFLNASTVDIFTLFFIFFLPSTSINPRLHQVICTNLAIVEGPTLYHWYNSTSCLSCAHDCWCTQVRGLIKWLGFKPSFGNGTIGSTTLTWTNYKQIQYVHDPYSNILK